MERQNYIVCVDMDAFFASIEQRDNPSYRGKPIIVGADPKVGRGVVSTCSYEARKYGIKSAMPIREAYRLCPFAIFLRPDIEKYTKVSQQIYEILYTFTPIIERVSIDEAFLDISGSYHLFGTPLDTCRLIKEKIKSKTSLTASLGLAPTK
ncbi:MAG: DNA polymerase IV, partial [Candidatus Omnitrophica bacterium]|nr:DNA polymerase IV [Candidatus Omnitrophota bacterium]